MVKILKPILRIKAQNNVNNWPEMLKYVMASKNSAISETTGRSAYYALYGFEPRMSIESEFQNVDKDALTRHEEIRQKTLESKAKQEKYYNRRNTSVMPFFVGDQVVVRKFGHVKALDTIFEEFPSKILEVRGPDSYIVEKPGGKKAFINARDLKLVNTETTDKSPASTVKSPVKPAKESPASPTKSTVTTVPSTVESPQVIKKVIVPRKPAKTQPLIGSRVDVYWPRYDKNYSGIVRPSTDGRKGSHIVDYDDGDSVFEWLEPKNKNSKTVEFTQWPQRSLEVDYKKFDQMVDPEWSEDESDEDFPQVQDTDENSEDHDFTSEEGDTSSRSSD
jgi:hypothetical protein